MKQQQMEYCSNQLILSKSTRAISTIQNKQQIRFEVEPTERSRIRYLSDWKPTNYYKRDDHTKSETKHPTYFPDRNNNHYLNLLVRYVNKTISIRVSILDSKKSCIQRK